MTGAGPSRGFTLIELSVALALAVVVIGVATTVMVNTVRDGRRTRTHSEMMRDATFTGQLFSQELRQAGLGVPNGDHIDAGYGTAPRPSRFRNAIIVAAPDQIGVVADLPRPDATYNAYGALHNRTIATPTNAMWHTENNGACAPDGALVGTSCNTGTTSTFFPGEVGCNTAASFGDRTCPWGMRRVVANDKIVIVSGDGRWAHATFGNSMTTTAPGFVMAAVLAPGYAPAPWPAPPGPAPAVVSPGDVPGQGWVASLDRVFFRHNSAASTIERMQCTGDPDPEHASWPDPAATAIPVDPAAVPGTRCGPFEIIARNVVSLTFSYFNVAGVSVAAPASSAAAKQSIRRVGYRIGFRRVVEGRPVTHEVAGSVSLRNL